MLTIVRRTAGLWWQTWPLLTAIYLIGWFLRYWSLHLAVAVGLAHGNLWAYLVLPLAALVRLLSYLAMFLVFRSVTPELRDATLNRGGERGLFDIVTTALVPFLLIYCTWKLIYEDFMFYTTSVEYQKIYELTPEELQAFRAGDAGVRLWAVIAVAFALRQLITRFRDRLPRWTLVVAAYLEALWLFLVLTATFKAVFGSPRWIAERRVIVWFGEQRNDLLSHLGVLLQWWHWSNAHLGMLVSVFGLSLAWLAVASAVYGVPFAPTWADARRAMLGRSSAGGLSGVVRAGHRRIAPRWRRLPALIRVRLMEFVRQLGGRFGPIVDAARLVLHVGAVPVAFFVAAYAALVVLSPSGAYFSGPVTDGYLFRAVGLMLGPHGWLWWSAYRDTIRVAIGAVVDPLRVALIAATYWYCVDRVRARQVEPSSARLEPDHPAT